MASAMSPARISVAMATFNGALYLREQLDSIAAQEIAPQYELEIVVADDGSSDDTLDVLKECEQHGAPIRVFPRRGGDGTGVVATFNRALRASRGEVVFLADQDDVWPPQRLAILLGRLEKGADLVYGDFIATDEALRPIRRVRLGAADDGLVFQNRVPGMTMGFRRWLVAQETPIHPDAPIHDWWLLLLAIHLGRVEYLPEVVTFYRQHAGNAIGLKRQRRSVSEYVARLEGRARFYAAVAARVASKGRTEDLDRLERLAAFYERLSTLRFREFLRLSHLPLLLENEIPRRALFTAARKAVLCRLSS